MESWWIDHVAAPGGGLFAYLDPGTGSFAVQLLLAGLFGGMYALRSSWSDLKLWASRRAERVAPPERPGPAGLALGTRTTDIDLKRHPAHGRTSGNRL
jgi:hypothetical protein